MVTGIAAPKDISDVQKTKFDFNFYGRGAEFLGMCLANVFLTVLTLDIYSAWAKVRTNCYFYANTQLGNLRFSYLAYPMQILKGRLIAILVFGLFYLAFSLSYCGAINLTW